MVAVFFTLLYLLTQTRKHQFSLPLSRNIVNQCLEEDKAVARKLFIKMKRFLFWMVMFYYHRPAFGQKADIDNYWVDIGTAILPTTK